MEEEFGHCVECILAENGYIRHSSGTKGRAAKWVRDFKSIVKTQRYGKPQWDALLPTCLKKDALRFFNTKRHLYLSYSEFFEEFIFFFDNRSSDDEYYHFREVFKQREAQDFDSWILIFEDKIQQMQMISQYPSYDEENFHEVFMRDLYCKLNKQCFAIVTKKLKDLQTEAKDCSYIERF